MDLHPIVIHFPIALLTIYAFMEFFRIKKLKGNETWFYIKAVFVILGVIGAMASMSTGEVAQHQYDNNQYKYLVEFHSGAAGTATNIFAIMAVIYALTIFDMHFSNLIKGKAKEYWKKLMKIKDFVLKSPIAILIAAAGLAALILTGILGGILVHGVDADPLAKIVMQFL